MLHLDDACANCFYHSSSLLPYYFLQYAPSRKGLNAIVINLRSPHERYEINGSEPWPLTETASANMRGWRVPIVQHTKNLTETGRKGIYGLKTYEIDVIAITVS